MEWSKTFKSIEFALERLNSSTFHNELKDVNEIIWIRLNIEQNFEIFASERLQKFNGICSSKSVVVSFISTKYESLSIFWKSSKIDYFLTLKPPKKKRTIEIQELYGFVEDFLIFFLGKEHLGKFLI